MRPTFLFLSILVVLLTLTVACTKTDKTSTSGTAGPGTADTQTADTPEQAPPVDMSTAEPEIILPAVDPASLPNGWRDDLPLPEGFEVQEFSAANGEMTAITMGEIPVDPVFNFYANLKGWEKDPNAPWRTDGDQRAIRYIKDDVELSIAILREGEKTRLQLRVAKQK